MNNVQAEVLMVGDDVRVDVLGAQEAGFQVEKKNNLLRELLSCFD